MKYPVRTPAASVASCLPATRPAPVRTALPAKPSTETVKAPVASLAPNPDPVTLTAVPLGPEAGEMDTVAAAEAKGSAKSGSASERSRITVIIAAFVLFVFKGMLRLNLCIFLFSPIFLINAVETI